MDSRPRRRPASTRAAHWCNGRSTPPGLFHTVAAGGKDAGRGQSDACATNCMTGCCETRSIALKNTAERGLMLRRENKFRPQTKIFFSADVFQTLRSVFPGPPKRLAIRCLRRLVERSASPVRKQRKARASNVPCPLEDNIVGGFAQFSPHFLAASIKKT